MVRRDVAATRYVEAPRKLTPRADDRTIDGGGRAEDTAADAVPVAVTSATATSVPTIGLST